MFSSKPTLESRQKRSNITKNNVSESARRKASNISFSKAIDERVIEDQLSLSGSNHNDPNQKEKININDENAQNSIKAVEICRIGNKSINSSGSAGKTKIRSMSVPTLLDMDFSNLELCDQSYWFNRTSFSDNEIEVTSSDDSDARSGVLPQSPDADDSDAEEVDHNGKRRRRSERESTNGTQASSDTSIITSTNNHNPETRQRKLLSNLKRKRHQIDEKYFKVDKNYSDVSFHEILIMVKNLDFSDRILIKKLGDYFLTILLVICVASLIILGFGFLKCQVFGKYFEIVSSEGEFCRDFLKVYGK